MLNRFRHIAASALMLAAIGSAHADGPVKIVVPTAAGSGADVGARALASVLSARLNVPVIVENRPGAGALVGYNAVLNAPADGTTLFFHNVATMTPVFLKGFSGNVLKDLEPVAALVRYNYAFFVNGSLPVRDLGEFTSYVRSRPGKLNYAQPASTAFLMMETFKAQMGLDLAPIPYKGSVPGAMALLANEVQASLAIAGVHRQDAQAGKVKVLFVTGPARLPDMPDVPTAAEAGVRGMDFSMRAGMWVRAGTSASVIEKLKGALLEAGAVPEVQQAFRRIGLEPQLGSSTELSDNTAREMNFWASAAKTANFVAE